MKPRTYIKCPQCDLNAHVFGVTERGAYKYSCPNYHKTEIIFENKKTEQTDIVEADYDDNNPLCDPRVIDFMGEMIREQIDNDILDEVKEEGKTHNRRRIYLYERAVEEPKKPKCDRKDKIIIGVWITLLIFFLGLGGYLYLLML